MRIPAAPLLAAGALLAAVAWMTARAPVATAGSPPPTAAGCPAGGLDGLLCELLRLAVPTPPSPSRPVPPARPPRPAPAAPAPAVPEASAGSDATPLPEVLRPASDPFLLQLLELLYARRMVRPQYLHFRPAAAPAPPTPQLVLIGDCPAARARCLPAEVPERVGATGLLVVLGAAALLTVGLRPRRRRPGWKPLLAVAGAGAAAVAIALFPGTPVGSSSALGAAVAAAVARLGTAAVAAPRAPAPAAADPWQRLLALERRIAEGPDTAALEAENVLYREAAADPSTRAVLVAGATGSGIPGVLTAVVDNLGSAAAETADEMVVAGAEASLAHYAALRPVQLRAIADHQPLIVPVVAPVTQWFGPTDLWLEPPRLVDGIWYPHFHTGIDLAAPFDTPVHAAADGVVLAAGTSTDGDGRPIGYGTYVVIAHSAEVISLYGHLDRLAVVVGDRVHQGQIIGLEGSTGMSTGPHVHFELRERGVPIDPAPYLRGQLGAAT